MLRQSNNPEDLRAYQGDWNRCAERLGLPMARTEWLLAAYAHLTEPDACKLLLLTDNDNRLRAGAALERKRDARGRLQYNIAGSGRLYEPASLIYVDDAAHRDLLQAMSRQAYPIVLLRDWPKDGTVQNDLRWGATALHIQRSSASSQYMDITGSYDALSEQMSGQRRYDLRRARRRAEAAGELRADILFPTPEQIPALLDQAAQIEAKSWKGAAGSALIDHAGTLDFFRTALQAYARHGQSYFAFLNVGTDIAAMQFGLFAHARFWVLKIGYDPVHAKSSPGLLLMDEVIRYAHAQSHEGIEFLGSSEPWIHTWNPRERVYSSTLVYPYRPASLWQLAGDVAQSVGKRLPGLMRRGGHA